MSSQVEAASSSRRISEAIVRRRLTFDSPGQGHVEGVGQSRAGQVDQRGGDLVPGRDGSGRASARGGAWPRRIRGAGRGSGHRARPGTRSPGPSGSTGRPGRAARRRCRLDPVGLAGVGNGPGVEPAPGMPKLEGARPGRKASGGSRPGRPWRANRADWSKTFIGTFRLAHQKLIGLRPGYRDQHGRISPARGGLTPIDAAENFAHAPILSNLRPRRAGGLGGLAGNLPAQDKPQGMPGRPRRATSCPTAGPSRRPASRSSRPTWSSTSSPRPTASMPWSPPAATTTTT